ncbi:hypothetical protein ACT8ZV_19225 [Nocardioides sp. MAHUQ-72]|uniref:hypothetical protein n=1 Tax=unclassified Nocardioides TaxID=2615069 RepID=UPI00360AF69E
MGSALVFTLRIRRADRALRAEVGRGSGEIAGATPDRIVAIEADPRWRTERLPTDRSVVGGWLPVAGLAVLGMPAGLGAAAAVVSLAG